MSRPSLDTYFLAMAALAASRSTCARRDAGCVLVDEQGVLLASGYNGTPRGHAHCKDEEGGSHVKCPAASLASGSGLDDCAAIHAEQNAVAFCPDVRRVHKVYLTVTPCVPCTKLLLQTGARHMLALAEYPDHERSMALWGGDGQRMWAVASMSGKAKVKALLTALGVKMNVAEREPAPTRVGGRRRPPGGCYF